MLTSDSMLSQGQLAHNGVDVSQTEWEVYMCYRALRELSGQFYSKLPTPIKDELRDAGLCHYMAVIRSPQGQLIQFDFGPRGKDVEWRPASNNSSSSNSSGNSQQSVGSSSRSSGGNSSAGGFRRDQLLQCTMSDNSKTPAPSCVCKTENSSGSSSGSGSGNISSSNGDRSGSSCGCAAPETFLQQAQRMGLQDLACNALMQHGAGNGSGMASLTLHQMDLSQFALPPPNGEIREELIGELPQTAVRVGVTRMSIAEMRSFYSSLDFNYLLNRNDCRHFVDAFVHYTTGVDRASARLIRANMDLRMRARPWQPVDPVILVCQRILEKENTYRVFTACHAAFTSLSSAVLLRVGIQSGRLHQRLARMVHSSAMAALRRALPRTFAIGGAAAIRGASGPLGLLSAAMAAGAVAAAAAVAATGMRVRGMASRQLKQLVGLPHGRPWPKPALPLPPAALPPTPSPQPALALAIVPAATVGAGSAQQQQVPVAAVGSGSSPGSGSAGAGQGGVAMRIEVPAVGSGSVATNGTLLSPKSPNGSQQQQQQQVQPCSPQSQQTQQQQQSQQQQVNAAAWPLGSRRGRKAKASTELKAQKKTRKAAVTGSKKIPKSGTKASGPMVSCCNSSSSSGGVSSGVKTKGGSKAVSSDNKGLPALFAHLSPLSSLLVSKAAALGDGLKTCLAHRPLLNDALQMAALP